MIFQQFDGINAIIVSPSPLPKISIPDTPPAHRLSWIHIEMVTRNLSLSGTNLERQLMQV